jgi:hypothetical protein
LALTTTYHIVPVHCLPKKSVLPQSKWPIAYPQVCVGPQLKEGKYIYRERERKKMNKAKSPLIVASGLSILLRRSLLLFVVVFVQDDFALSTMLFK